MRELGYEVGKNLVIEWRFAEGHVDRLAGQAADLVNREVDVIVGAGTAAVRAAKQATSTIPIVMSYAGDPVSSGFIASLARPGGNITGLSLATTDTSAKWLELAKLVAPRSQVGVLADPNQPTVQWHVKNIQSAAQQLGGKAPVAYAPRLEDIESSFALLAKEQVTAAIVLPSALFNTHATLIARTALKHRIASIATTRIYAERGALLAYGQNYGAFTRRAATYVDKILKGAKPSDLPVEQPTIFELTVNRATAKQLGLTISKELLLRADMVIE
ncbi:MAG: ABC transporter substrate-binding protein [Betaproteobacteria bacterium]